jgi:hypothetical protein
MDSAFARAFVSHQTLSQPDASVKIANYQSSKRENFLDKYYQSLFGVRCSLFKDVDLNDLQKWDDFMTSRFNLWNDRVMTLARQRYFEKLYSRNFLEASK